jgi:hypothetical protein
MKMLSATLILVVAAASGAAAQQIWVGGGWGGGGRAVPKWARPADFDGRFNFCRASYTAVRRLPSGSGWNTDYPGADINFSVRLAELTRVAVAFDADRQPNHVVISLADPLLFRCPIVFMTHVASARFSEEEVAGLGAYLRKGGFVWIDDSWGSAAWSFIANELARVLPPGEFPLVDLPADHAIRRTVYDIAAVPQIPSISHWRRSGGGTSERGRDSAEVYVRGIQDAKGRLMVLVTHNTDISDAWEREGEEPRGYFDAFSPTGYAIGVNVVVYALTR